MRRGFLGIVCALLLASSMWGENRIKSPSGPYLYRADYGQVVLQYNENLFPGVLNAFGRTMMTADSDPVAALNEIAATWSNIDGSMISFAPPVVTNEDASPTDGKSTIVLKDTPENRSIVGTALAVTFTRFAVATGQIVDTDITLNPLTTEIFGAPFATTGNSNVIDFTSVVMHEVGHLLGSTHSPLLGATMFYSGGTFDPRRLSEDDKAFARAAAPMPGLGAYGQLRGEVLMPDGLSPARGISIIATDRTSGVTLSALTNLSGQFLMESVPAGNYVVFAEPLDGPTPLSAVNLTAATTDTNVEAMFVGGGDTPTVFTVGRGTTMSAEFLMRPTTSTVDIRYFARGRVGGTTDATGSGAFTTSRGEKLDLIIGGPGIVTQFPNAKIELIGAGATIVPGSVRIAQASNTIQPTVRFTVEITGAPIKSLISIVYRTPTSMSTVPGVLVVAPSGTTLSMNPAAILNAASYASGPVAPSSWVSLYAESLASQLKVSGASLATILDGTTVQVTDGVGARSNALLQFVAPNQINFLMPSTAASGIGRVSVTTSKGTGIVDFTINSVAPGIFAANADGRGPAASTFLTVLPSGEQKSGFTFNAAGSPRANTPIDISSGDTYLIFYGTGLRRYVTPPASTVGGILVPVLAAVAQGQFQGLDQINIGPLPKSLVGAGEVPVLFNFDGKLTNFVTVNIK